MNPVDVVESVRPEVPPMDLAERRMIRERLFGVGHGDVARNITARSASGAVVSTAPRGTRALSAPQSPPQGSWARMAAGLVLLAGLGGLGWLVVGRDDSEPETRVEAVVETTAAPTTAQPTTTVEVAQFDPVRTAVTADFPLVLPSSQLAIDTVSIGAPAAGSSAALFAAPDGTNVWLAEIDGDRSNTNGLTVTQVGATQVATPSDFVDGDPPSYQVQVPCGFVLLNDAPDQPLFRPEMQRFLESTSVDDLATIDVGLPDGWTVLDIGPSVTSFDVQFQVPRFDSTASVALSQAPNGSLAQLAFGGRQLQETVFLGDVAYVDSAPLSPGSTSVFWRDGATVFNIRSDELDFIDLEDFVIGLDTVSVAEFSERFDQPVPPTEPIDAGCTPQPSLGTTLDP